MRDKLKFDLIQYQKAHQNKWNQILHYFAFLCAFLAWIFLFINLKVTLCLGVCHYILSWIGHFYFEKNKPASFKRPLLGFYAGFTWFFLRSIELVTGRKVLP
ncbi:DUF962 domain-containing protein [Paenibacillus qinlingensis]|uniref:DUF962 domain-containing protein n=1 Tax=Paenibacillus qinlingensis TaxID=1837343 RepID=A0ABU1P5H2_9BACL|nr:DUF962 domain-containing protein [Paenibacillus qinlingensis]MDR6555005.1 hypothetical protein [Paenibacillus qinlingensis]